MKKRFNLTRYGHGTYPHNKSHFDLYETLESILKSNKSKKYFYFIDRKLIKTVENILFVVPFAGEDNFNKHYKKIINYKFSLINTEWIVGNDNIKPELYTFDNYLLCKYDSQKKNIIILLKLIYWNWRIKKNIYNFILKINNKFLKKILNYIFAGYCRTIYYIDHNNNNIFYYWFHQTSWWKEQFDRFYLLSKKSERLIEYPAGKTKYGEIFCKKMNLKYSSLQAPIFQKKNITKNLKNKKIDFFYSGKMNKHIHLFSKYLAKNSKLKFYFSKHLPTKKRDKIISESKYVLGLTINNLQNVYSAMRIAYNIGQNIPILYISETHFQPRWMKRYIFSTDQKKALSKMMDMSKNYIKYKKNFFKNRKKFIKRFKKSLINFKKDLKI